MHWEEGRNWEGLLKEYKLSVMMNKRKKSRFSVIQYGVILLL